jgi:hypothetical protein
MEQINWVELEAQHDIRIERNTAVLRDREIFGDALFTVKAILGTKAAEINFFGIGPIDTQYPEKFTEENVPAELNNLCLFTLAQRLLAHKQLAAEAAATAGSWQPFGWGRLPTRELAYSHRWRCIGRRQARSCRCPSESARQEYAEHNGFLCFAGAAAAITAGPPSLARPFR